LNAANIEDRRGRRFCLVGFSGAQKLDYTRPMRNEFTAVIERDGDSFVAWSPEIPGANGQGRSVEECRESLSAAVQLIQEDRQEDGLRDCVVQ